MASPRVEVARVGEVTVPVASYCAAAVVIEYRIGLLLLWMAAVDAVVVACGAGKATVETTVR